VALNLLSRALAETEVAGTVTNLAFLGALSRHAGFSAGDVDTGLIARDLDDLTRVQAPDDCVLALAAIAAADLLDGGADDTGFTLWSPLRQRIRFGDHVAHILPLARGRFTVETDAGSHICELRGTQWWIDGRRAGHALRHAAGISVFAGETWHFAVHDPLQQDAEQAAGSGLTVAPMPGLVKTVYVSQGDVVAAGDRLVVLEAMKMEHTLSATRAGRIAELLTAEGQQVEAGAALIRLEEEDG
jgi:3-methylcrotonyl-CoA carboxylase alpha subunit